jgi:hypothetical protein
MTLYSGGVEPAAVYNIQLDGVVSTDPLTVKSGAPSTVRFQILPTPILDAFVAPVNPDVAEAKTLLVRLLCEMCASDSLQEQWIEYDAPERTSTEATFAVTPTVEASLLNGGRGRLLFTVLNDGRALDEIALEVVIQPEAIVTTTVAVAQAVPPESNNPAAEQPDLVIAVGARSVDGYVGVSLTPVLPALREHLGGGSPAGANRIY